MVINFRAFIFFIFVIFSAVQLCKFLLEDTAPNLVELPLNYAIELLKISSSILIIPKILEGWELANFSKIVENKFLFIFYTTGYRSEIIALFCKWLIELNWVKLKQVFDFKDNHLYDTERKRKQFCLILHQTI